MTTLIDTLTLSPEERMIVLAGSIGGSESAAALGLSRWTTPLRQYQKKIGEVGPEPDNPAMYWGRKHEATILQEYAEQTGRVIHHPGGTLLSEKYPFMHYTPDGLAEDGRLIEAKTAKSDAAWGEPGTDEVPEEYLIQVQHGMIVTELPVADIPVLIGGNDYRIYTVPADPELQAMIIEGLREFMDRVHRRIPPDPVSRADFEAAMRGKSGVVEATEQARHAVADLLTVKARMKALEADKERLEGIIIATLGAGKGDSLIDGITGNTLATWKETKPVVRLDSKALKAAHPAIYQEFMKVGEPMRQLRLKKEKEEGK